MFIFQTPPTPTSTSPPYVVIAAAITAAVSLAGAVMGWVKDRNSVARRSQIIDEATKYVAFWTAVRDAEEARAPYDKKATLKIEYEKRIQVAKRLVDMKATYLPRADYPDHQKLKWRIYLVAIALFAASLVLFVQHLLRKTGAIDLDADSNSFARDPTYITAGALSIAAGVLLLFWIGVKYYRNRRTPRLTIDQWIATQTSAAPPQIESSDD